MSGNIVHIEIPTTDMSTSTKFYSALFGWEMNQLKPSYTLFKTPPKGPAGGLDASLKPMDGGIIFYIEVEDIDATLLRVAEFGGETITPKTVISEEIGYYAIFKDPCGNRIGLWSQK